jgi:hypothetical protein
MRLKSLFFPLFFISILLPSCEFHCSVGKKEDPVHKTNLPIHTEGATIYNGIELVSYKVKLNKAYLVFADGERVPEDNFVDFDQPVKLLLFIDSGWATIDKKVMLGASEKVVAEYGEIILNKQDLFELMPGGISENDAKIIGLTVTLKIKQGSPPSFYTIPFRVWDKRGEGYIEGTYKLYSK